MLEYFRESWSSVHCCAATLETTLHLDWTKVVSLLCSRLPFFGFGGGARLCPGADLAWLEILVFLHQLVTKFQWELCGGDVESYFPLPKLSKGLQINVHKHIKSDPLPSACWDSWFSSSMTAFFCKAGNWSSITEPLEKTNSFPPCLS
jgi:hypothetical protein